MFLFIMFLVYFSSTFDMVKIDNEFMYMFARRLVFFVGELSDRCHVIIVLRCCISAITPYWPGSVVDNRSGSVVNHRGDSSFESFVFLLRCLLLLLGFSFVLLRVCMMRVHTLVEVQDARGAMPCKLRQDDHDKVLDEYVQISSLREKSPDGWNKTSLLLGSQHHPRTYNQNKHLLHSLLQVTN